MILEKAQRLADLREQLSEGLMAAAAVDEAIIEEAAKPNFSSPGAAACRGAGGLRPRL